MYSVRHLWQISISYLLDIYLTSHSLPPSYPGGSCTAILVALTRRNGSIVQVHDIGVGCILWLPPYNDSEGERSRPQCELHGNTHRMNDHGFDHPVVVLDIYDRYGRNPSIRFITVSLPSETELYIVY